MVFDQFLNSIFNPLLALGPIYAIAGVSLIISLISAILYRVLIHQETMKRIKSEQKDLQKKIQTAQKSGDEKALKGLFSSSMELNSRMMMLTIKPMIVAMVVYLLLIPWLSGNFGDVTVKLNDNQGVLKFNGITENVAISGNAIAFGGQTYASGDAAHIAGKTLTVQHLADKNEVLLQNVRFNLPFYFPLVGTQVGWLGLYIIISLPATMLFRKILGVD